MQTVEELGVLRSLVGAWRASGQRIALVPTMGNLHDGHLSLVEAARAQADRVITTIFVNPTQFGPNEDYARYPRTLSEDQAGLASRDCDLLFVPNVELMYPHGVVTTTTVEVPEVSQDLCGASRPGHFRGVATVVTKLLNMVQPDIALFGEKDYQQLLVIRRLVEDLALPVAVVGFPIVRETDGLAMSSRNRYLSADDRRRAPSLYRVLTLARKAIKAGVDPEHACEEGLKSLLAAGFEPDYLEVRRAADLRPVGGDDQRLILLAAARLGNTRLIDNLQFDRA